MVGISSEMCTFWNSWSTFLRISQHVMKARMLGVKDRAEMGLVGCRLNRKRKCLMPRVCLRPTRLVDSLHERLDCLATGPLLIIQQTFQIWNIANDQEVSYLSANNTTFSLCSSLQYYELLNVICSFLKTTSVCSGNNSCPMRPQWIRNFHSIFNMLA